MQTEPRTYNRSLVSKRSDDKYTVGRVFEMRKDDALNLASWLLLMTDTNIEEFTAVFNQIKRANDR
jgi:hypothetical protein